MCGVGTLLGTKSFAAAPPENLAGAQYSLERRLVTSKAVSRASALRRTMYLDFYLIKAVNSAPAALKASIPKV